MPTNPLLQRERDHASFSSEELTNLLDGGPERTARRREIEGWIINDPDLRHPPLEFLTRDQIYTLQLAKAAKMTRLMQEKELTDKVEMYWMKKMLDTDYGSPLELHIHMFLPAILGQGSDEQIERWFGQALAFRMIGTYAQTEMGHGSFLRGIETTATYDRSSQEFILDTPTVTATKWWPGSLGKTTNHALVMARLIIDGTEHGPHLFLLQTRDMETHEPRPGVILGDIGPKMGYQAIDNGFMRLRRVRVPRENMLMRHAKVTAEGRYERRAENRDKLSYGTMTLIRALIVGGMARSLMQAVTIAARYSVVRQQGEMEEGGGEVSVIEYPTQQHKILPLVARSFAFYFCGERIREAQFNLQGEIAAGRMERLSEHHALTSCLKAIASDECTAGVEVCRKACGGHGYSLASGLPQIYVHNTPACTYEGENTVLLLQTARYLLKIHQELLSNSALELPPSVAYLKERSAPLHSPPDVCDPLWLQAIHDERARRLLQAASDVFRKDLALGTTWQKAFHNCSIQLIRVVKAHASRFLLASFLSSVPPPGRLQKVLLRLAVLVGLQNATEESGEFLQTNCFSAPCLSRCQSALEQTLAALRPDLIALVDAFDVSDYQLKSVLGRYDGQVYENLYAWAAASPLNKTEVHSSFQSTIQPLMSGADMPPLSKL